MENMNTKYEKMIKEMENRGFNKLTFNEATAAKIIGITPQTLKKYRDRDTGPSHTLISTPKSKRAVYTKEDIAVWLSK